MKNLSTVILLLVLIAACSENGSKKEASNSGDEASIDSQTREDPTESEEPPDDAELQPHHTYGYVDTSELFGTWSQDKEFPEFTIDAEAYHLVGEMGGSLPYTIHHDDSITVEYEFGPQSGLIASTKDDKLVIFWNDHSTKGGMKTIYYRYEAE